MDRDYEKSTLNSYLKRHSLPVSGDGMAPASQCLRPLAAKAAVDSESPQDQEGHGTEGKG